MARHHRLVLLGLCVTVTAACSVLPLPAESTLHFESPATNPPPTLVPTFLPQPTITPQPPDTGWHSTHPGIEVRSVDVLAGQLTERVSIARLDPHAVTLRVEYSPGVAYPVSVWAQRLGALMVVNGGYFTEEARVTGLTVVDGQSFGTPYGDFAGMVAVTADGVPSVRWLRTWPYDPVEPLQSAIQSFPVLVKPGGVMGFPADGDDGRTSRRTVAAQDDEGRILLLAAPRGYLSLHALAVWLAESDLDLDTALNLDGGTSTGFWMAGGSATSGTQIESLTAVPAVIGVFVR